MATQLAAGALPPEKAAVAPQLIFNQHLDAWLTIGFVVLLWVVVLDMLRVAAQTYFGKAVIPTSEVPYQVSRL
jgi:carbon starvation protein